jgi:hypothetical protein
MLEKHGADFFNKLNKFGVKPYWGEEFDLASIRAWNSAEGDKCYCYRFMWEEAGIPFWQGVAVYYLTKMKPYSDECRDVYDVGWGFLPVNGFVIISIVSRIISNTYV